MVLFSRAIIRLRFKYILSNSGAVALDELKMASIKDLNLLEAITEIAHEREIDRELLLSALEDSILQAAQRKYTNFDNIEVELNRKTGEVTLQQYRVVAETVEDLENEISLKDAQRIDSSAELGDEISFPIKNQDFSNTIAQATRQILLGKVRDIEREAVMKKFSGKLLEIVHGKVARIESNRVYVILGSNIEGVLERREMLWNDRFQSGEMIRALLLDLRHEGRQHVLVLSRTHPEFLHRLLSAEIPEIYDGSIDILKIAREAGRKSKVVVQSKDPDIDPVGACIGARGTRISPIINELNGERVDILTWKNNPAEMISEALNTEGIEAITINEDESLAYVEIQDEFLPAAIGKQGQNVRLAQKITGVQIKFVPVSPENKRKELLSELFKNDPQHKATSAPETAPGEEATEDSSAQTASDKKVSTSEITKEESLSADQKPQSPDNPPVAENKPTESEISEPHTHKKELDTPNAQEKTEIN